MSSPIDELIDLLSRLPGIGRRNATRLVFHMFEVSPDYAQRLGECISSFHEKIHKCDICANISDMNPCEICKDRNRNQALVCVVEGIPDLWAIEEGGTYPGVFHVLHGLLSPLDNVGPDDLNIELLVERVDRNDIEEIIVATRPSVEGEATAVLIREALEGRNVKTTRIASGIPLGSELEYTDAVTLEKALLDRREF